MAVDSTQYLQGAPSSSAYHSNHSPYARSTASSSVNNNNNNNNNNNSNSSSSHHLATTASSASSTSSLATLNATSADSGSPLSPLSSPLVPISSPTAAIDPSALFGIKPPSPTDYDAYLRDAALDQHNSNNSMASAVMSGNHYGQQPFATGHSLSQQQPQQPFAPNGMTRTNSNSSGSGGGGGGGPSGGQGPITRMRSGASVLGNPSLGASAGFVSFDPDQDDSELLLEGDDYDDEEPAHVEGRPRKRKSVRDLRSAANSSAHASSAAAGGGGNGSGAGAGGDAGGDKDDDKSRRKIQIEYIEEKSKRHITFSKRKAGIMKKAYELSTLTGTQVLLLVVSESGWVYTFTTDKFKPLVKEDENGQLSQGQRLIAACLEAKDGAPNLAAAACQNVNASSTGNFEANSSQHGGQISLKTGSRAARPTVTNRRLSSKTRSGAPTSINIGNNLMDPSLPCPPNSGGGIPPLPQLPTPLSGGGYLGQDPMHSPLSPAGMQAQGRSLSHPPISPGRSGYSMQQQQQQAHHQQQQEYAELMQRTDMLQLQNPYDQSGAQHYDLYSTDIYTSDLQGLPPLPQPPSHISHHHSDSSSLPSPVHPRDMQHQQQLHLREQQQHHPTLSHSRSFSHSHRHRGEAHGQHRTLHHQASHGHLPSSSSSALYHNPSQQQDSPFAHNVGDLSVNGSQGVYLEQGLSRNGGGGSHYSHGRSSSMSGTPSGSGIDPGLMNPRTTSTQGAGWSTPSNPLQQQQDRSRQGSVQGTPIGMGPGGLAYAGDDVYVR